MIETREGFDNVEEIVSTPGLDGVYIGPADLALGLTDGRLAPGFDRKEEEMISAIRRILASAQSRWNSCRASLRLSRIRRKGGQLGLRACDAFDGCPAAGRSGGPCPPRNQANHIRRIGRQMKFPRIPA